jgi:hypothetical protein
MQLSSGSGSGLAMDGSPSLSTVLTLATQWTTGEETLDQYVRDTRFSETTLSGLAQLPLNERRNILRSTVKKQPTHPDSWLNACITASKKKNSSPQPAPQMHVPPLKHQRVDSPSAACLPLAVQGQIGSLQMKTLAQASDQLTAPPVLHPIAKNLWPAASPSKALVVPDWVRHAHSVSDNKSAFVQALYQQLDPLRFELFTKLPPTMQLHLGMSVIVNPLAWGNVNEHLKQCLRVLDELQNPNAMANQAVTLQRREVRLVIVHNGAGIGDGHIVLHAALSIVQKLRTDIAFTIVKIYSFGSGVNGFAVEKHVVAGMGSSVDFCGDPSDLPMLIAQHKASWAGSKLLFLNKVPIDESISIPPTCAQYGRLHLKGSRGIWSLSSAISDLHPDVPHTSHIQLTDLGRKCQVEGEHVLEPFCGKAFIVNSRYYGVAQWIRNLRTNLIKLDLTHYHGSLDPHLSFDGWVWLGNYDSSSNLLTSQFPTATITGGLPQWIAESVFDKGALKPEQAAAILSFRMQHQQTQETRYLDRRFWCAWIGCGSTPLEKALNEVLPCVGLIMAVTGAAPPPNSNVGESCGVSRYCTTCESALTLLATSWHIPMMADVLVCVLRKALEQWVDCSSDEIFILPSRQSVHSCGPACDMNPVPGI